MTAADHDRNDAVPTGAASSASAVCPAYAELDAGWDDPITRAYGAGEVIAAAVARHIATCPHPFCRDCRGELA